MVNLDIIVKIMEVVLTLIGVIGLIITIRFGFWVKNELKKVEKIEERLLFLRSELDGGLAKQLAHKAISMSIYEGRLKMLKEPIQAEYNKLELQRKFIIEKIPLIGLFKK